MILKVFNKYVDILDIYIYIYIAFFIKLTIKLISNLQENIINYIFDQNLKIVYLGKLLFQLIEKYIGIYN